jgi:hypothetical protein
MTFDNLKTGAVVVIGHPANNIVWFKTSRGWEDVDGRLVDLDDYDTKDMIGHGAYTVILDGK